MAPKYVICPHCAESRRRVDYLYVDPDGAVLTPPKREGVWTAVKGWNTPRQPASSSMPMGTKRKCPGAKCGGLLSNELFKRESRIVAVVGESRSSKTAFLAAGVHQWRNGAYFTEMGISYNQFGEDDDLENAIDRMFIEKYAPGTTFAYQEGIQHKVIIIVARTRRRREVNLVFIDVPGEDLVDEVLMDRAAKFISRAQHIFILLTPMVALDDRHSQMARAILETEVVNRETSSQEQRARTGNIQSAAGSLKMINGIKEMQGSDRIGGNQVGVSVILTKTDMLRALHDHPDYSELARGVIPPMHWLRTDTNGWVAADEKHGNVVDPTATAEMSERTRQLLAKMNPNLAEVIHQDFENPRYFAISASGGPGVAVEDGVRFHEVRPYRCIDPLIHMLTSIPALRLAEGGR